jgi:protein-S-isoprenylcysteine O-methyltransferase Ste14
MGERGKTRLFDPFGLLERVSTPTFAHGAVRAIVLALLVVFLVLRLGQYHNYFFKPLWAAESLIYVMFIVAYAVRVNPEERSRGVREIIIPLAGAVLPFALLASRPLAWVTLHPAALYAVFSSMTVFTAFTIWGMWALRASFSITVEARKLVRSGPYRFVRHPIYLGEMCAAAAVAIWRASPANAVLLCLFIAIQLLRARMEEEKLTAVFPQYAPYAAHTWWLYPAKKRS